MKWEGLIAASRILADLDGNAGSEDDVLSARLGKAVSAAYYAMFHALALKTQTAWLASLKLTGNLAHGVEHIEPSNTVPLTGS